MRRIISAIIFGFLIGTVWYVAKNVDWTSVLRGVQESKIYIQRDSEANFISDWTTDTLLEKINKAREEAGYSKLKINSKLDQAAKARLSVILSEKDIDGSITGISREKALSNVGYNASFVGELILTDFFKSNDPISTWSNNKTSNDTLFYTGFQDVGIAIKNSDEKVDVYVLLVSPRKVVKTTSQTTTKTVWGGIELWNEVNKRRIELGVNPLKQKEELCTIASIRLNQLLELGKLDGHAGFEPTLKRDDLKWISEKYNISEFLVQGYKTPLESVRAWENTMGHKALLSGGEYVWGCVYAQNTFGVAIAAY